MANSKKRIVEFEEVEGGKGVVLHFNFKDCRTLQNHLGEGWFNDAPDRLNRYDTEWIERFLLVGGKDAKGKPHPIEMDQIEDLTIAEVTVRILDALFLAVHGDTFVDYQIKVAKAIAEMQARGETPDPNPPNGPETSSGQSNNTLSGSDSTLLSSTSSPPAEQSSSS